MFILKFGLLLSARQDCNRWGSKWAVRWWLNFGEHCTLWDNTVIYIHVICALPPSLFSCSKQPALLKLVCVSLGALKYGCRHWVGLHFWGCEKKSRAGGAEPAGFSVEGPEEALQGRVRVFVSVCECLWVFGGRCSWEVKVKCGAAPVLGLASAVCWQMLRACVTAKGPENWLHWSQTSLVCHFLLW